MIETLERIAREVWAYHYRIPEPAYWVVGSAAVAALVSAPLTAELILAVAFVALLAAQGIARWHMIRRRCRYSMVVPLFQESKGAKGRAAEAQTLIVDDLRQHLPHRLRDLVQPIPTAITSAEDAFAA